MRDVEELCVVHLAEQHRHLLVLVQVQAEVGWRGVEAKGEGKRKRVLSKQ